MLCVCVPFLYPPFVIIGGSHGVSCSRASSNRHQQPVGDLHVEPEGGGAHGLFGRPGGSAELPVGPPAFSSGPLVTSWAHLSMAWGISFIMSVSCSGGPYTPYSNMCHVLICRNIVSWIKPHHYAAKLAQNHLHTF